MFNFIDFSQNDFIMFIIILLVAIISLILTKKLLKISFPYFFMGFLGLVIGLAIGSWLSEPLTKLPGEYGRWLPIIINIFVVVAVLDLFIAQAKSAGDLFNKLAAKILKTDYQSNAGEIVVDTSVLIDGRIQAIAETGFILGKLIIPRFVLEELQSVADSDDPIKRARGRRGMEVLSSLQKNNQIVVEIYDDNMRNKEKVDNKIVILAKEKKARLLTLDFNLNKIAQIQDVHVLNINELAESLKPVLIPGEAIDVKVIQKGKEKNQGVGYLPDGTMIVIEGGDKFVGETIHCHVIRIYHTVAGKMIFVEPKR